jgi:putative PEP-CTERM system TPR-repeat lipoprotein
MFWLENTPIKSGMYMKIGKGLIFIICIACLLGACSPKVTIDGYLAQAKVFSKKEDNNSAIIILKNAIRIYPKNHTIRFELGAAYLVQGDYLRAEKELEKAEKLGNDNELLMTYLVQVKVKLNKFDYVYQVASKLENVGDEKAVVILSYAGMAALYDGKRDVAQMYIDQAIEINNDSAYGKISKAYLTQSQEEVDEALNVVNNILLTSPNFSDAHLLKGHLLQTKRQHKEAVKSFEKYLEYRPKEIQTFFFIAQNYIADKQFDKAEPFIDKLLLLSKNNPLANQMKAQIEFNKKNYYSALEYGKVSFQQNDRMVSAIIIAGISAYHLEDFEQAYQNLRKVKDNLATSKLIHKVLIGLQLRLGYDTEAISAIHALVDSGEADASLLTSASQEMLKSGNVAAAQELLNASIQLTNESPEELTKQGIMKWLLI